MLKQILINARALIAQGWCQHFHAVDSEGRECYDDRRIVARCIVGALSHSIEYDIGIGFKEVREHLAKANHFGPGKSLTAFNDAPGRTKDEVLAAFDRAIAAA